MAVQLYKPGTEIERGLPRCKGVTVLCKVPDRDTAKVLIRQTLKIADDPECLYEEARKTFGRVFVRVEGVELADGTSVLELETDPKSGHLTEETINLIVPICQALWSLAGDLVTIDGDDRKN